MVCEVCKQKKATVHFKQVFDGTASELYLCESCAAKKGFNSQAPLALTDFLLGLGSPRDAEGPPAEDKACPACHMRRSDFRKTARLGCPACYETFADELAPMLDDMHRGTVHAGKRPAGAAASTGAYALRAALNKAVAEQNFEEAARLRDLIRGLVGEQTGPEARRF